MDILTQLNNGISFAIAGSVILCVILVSVFFLIRSYRAGIAIGMDKAKLKRAITASATFTLLPSTSILLGVIALSGSLGVPLPWVRLSMVGALQYEASSADIAARALGLSGLVASEMTASVFTTIALVMGVGIIWGLFYSLFGLKPYLKSVAGKPKLPGKKGFSDILFSAMFIGLISAYIGSYIGVFTSKGDAVPLVAAAVAAGVMGVFQYFIEKKNVAWLENFAVAAGMLCGMAAAVVVCL